MFELTLGELALVIFLFVLTWGAGRVPRLGERLGEWVAGRALGPADIERDGRDVRREKR
ncbi:MAG: twin-arginine translocase TatA/TatE family subunit [Myxococcota bacterium]|nr:twin-arginine translocase TatA/TatE family subunit [Myxococcota bacterium]